MTNTSKTFLQLGMAMVAGIALGLASMAFAQDEAPAAKAKPGQAKPTADADDNTAATQPAAAQEEDPAVLAVLDTKPTKPSECMRAAKLMADLQRPKLAKTFLRKVLDSKPDDEQLNALADEYSPTTFTELATHEDLLPEAQELSEAVLAAVNRQLQDPKRIEELIKQLQDPSEDVRSQAASGLRDARGAGVGAMIDVLADSGRAAEHPNLRAALAGMGSEAVGPLLGILDQSTPQLMEQAIRILGQMKAREAAIFLVGPATCQRSDPQLRAAAIAAYTRLTGQAPSPAVAVKMLTQRAVEYLRQRQIMPADSDGRVILWRLDAASRHCLPKRYRTDDASRVMALRLASDAFAVAPKDRAVKILYLTALLEQAVYENGLDKGIDLDKDAAAREAAQFGAATVEEVLDYAMKERYPAAALAAAQILGRIGKPAEVLRHAAEPAPLVRAVRDPDRRVRMAALAAIVQLQPAAPYSGSSFVPESLAYFASTSGVRRVLVGGANVEASRELAGPLASLGYTLDTATTGRELLRMAVKSPDYELALIDAGIDDSGIEITLEGLRRDHRTATLRVGILARAGFFEMADRVAHNRPLVMAFHRPHTAEAVRWQVHQLDAMIGRDFVDFGQRQRQAAEALAFLAVLGSSPDKLYDIGRVQGAVLGSLYTPKFGPRVAAVLAAIGTAPSQRALVDLASRPTQSLDARKAAAKAFRVNTQQNGLLLTTDEIRQQYARYQQSRNQDANSQHILSLLLDSIEAPSEKARLEQGLRLKINGSSPEAEPQPAGRLEPGTAKPPAPGIRAKEKAEPDAETDDVLGGEG